MNTVSFETIELSDLQGSGRGAHIVIALSFVLIVAFALNATAQAEELVVAGPPATLSVAADKIEPESTGWSVVIDNDALARPDSDQDYTGGLSIELSGRRATDYRFSLDGALGWVNRRLAVEGKREFLPSSHAIQFGVLVFTPEDFSGTIPRSDDRPFANLVFLANSQFALDPSSPRAYQTTLTVGILGSSLGESLQRTIHRAAGSATPTGYDSQISDGGELTARYSFARQSLLVSRGSSRGRSLELKSVLEGSLGYITEGSATIAARWGKSASPWWEFAPTRGNYISAPAPRAYAGGNGAARDSHLWVSATLRGRVYDVFLQGQFREREAALDSSELSRFVAELSVGWTVTLARNVTFSQSIHYQTSQIRRGVGAREHAWGTLSVARSF